MSVKKNKEIVRRLFEELNRRNLDVLDKIFAPSFLNHHPAPGTSPETERV